jgi:hypothetical protein
MALDDETWARARGWILWEATVQLVNAMKWGVPAPELAGVRLGWRVPAVQVLEDVLEEHRQYA